MGSSWFKWKTSSIVAGGDDERRSGQEKAGLAPFAPEAVVLPPECSAIENVATGDSSRVEGEDVE
jgi:hypothetical protein